eukprot:PhF_6_TR11545/c0_g1_i1/m.18543
MTHYELNFTPRMQESNVMYVLISNCTLDDIAISINYGLGDLSADEAIVRRVSETAKNDMVILIYMVADLTVGYAHMLSTVKPRDMLGPEYSHMRLPYYWEHIFRVKWIRISAFDADALASVVVDAHTGTTLSDRGSGLPVCVLPQESGVAICNMMDDAVNPKRSANSSHCPKSITKYNSHEEYVTATREMATKGGRNRKDHHGGGAFPAMGGGAGNHGSGGGISKPIQDILTRYTATKDVRVWTLEDVKGFAVGLSRTAEGASLLHTLIPKFFAAIDIILPEIVSGWMIMMRDPQASTICEMLLKHFKGNNAKLKQIFESLKDNISEAATHPTAHKVLMTCIEIFPNNGRETILRELLRSIDIVVADLYGCCVVGLLLETYAKAIDPVATSLLSINHGDWSGLMQSMNGHVVLKHILQSCTDSDVLDSLTEDVIQNLESYVLHPDASNAVTLLVKGLSPPHFASRCVAVLTSKTSTFMTVASNRHGSAVLNSALETVSSGSQIVDEENGKFLTVLGELLIPPPPPPPPVVVPPTDEVHGVEESNNASDNKEKTEGKDEKKASPPTKHEKGNNKEKEKATSAEDIAKVPIVVLSEDIYGGHVLESVLKLSKSRKGTGIRDNASISVRIQEFMRSRDEGGANPKLAKLRKLVS